MSGFRAGISPPHSIGIIDNIMRKVMDKAPVKKYIYELACNKVKSDGINNMAGILIRGTDYTKLKPAGHPIPPTPEMAAAKLDEFIAKYKTERVFLATEDKDIYDYFMNRYGNIIYTTDKNLIASYSGSDYVANAIHSVNKYQFGLDYLVKIICLSECRYLISSKTSGSNFARLLNNGRYIEDYNFELGRY